MKIYSWNMLFRNGELDRAFAFIRDSEWDIFCLQEVPEAFLKRLQTLPGFIAYRIDTERLLPEGVVSNYVVILSKHPIESRGEIPFPEYWQRYPLRSRLFIRIMRPFHFSRLRNRGGIFVDVMVSGRRVRVFNLHLILAQPAWRLTEFELAMAKHDSSQPTIVCGDFNIVESLLMTSLNWLFGARVSDALLHHRERTTIEQRFSAHGLTNILRGKVTHPFSRSQLDHILVSNTFSVTYAEVLKDRMGSDHCPIRVDIAEPRA